MIVEMLKKVTKFLVTFLSLASLLSAQDSPCLRAEKAFAGEFIAHDYSTSYYFDLSIFDFPVRKIWRANGSESVWYIPGGFIAEKAVTTVGREFVYPDTFRFERFIKANGERQIWQLTRFYGNIYQVWQILETHYAWAGTHTTLLLPIEVRCFKETFIGWPDDYMTEGAYKTDRRSLSAKLEKLRCKHNDAGRRKAGTN